MTIALNDLFKSVDCLRLARLDMCVLAYSFKINEKGIWAFEEYNFNSLINSLYDIDKKD